VAAHRRRFTLDIIDEFHRSESSSAGRALLRLAEINGHAALPTFGRIAFMNFHASQQSCAI